MTSAAHEVAKKLIEMAQADLRILHASSRASRYRVNRRVEREAVFLRDIRGVFGVEEVLCPCSARPRNSRVVAFVPCSVHSAGSDPFDFDSDPAIHRWLQELGWLMVPDYIAGYTKSSTTHVPVLHVMWPKLEYAQRTRMMSPWRPGGSSDRDSKYSEDGYVPRWASGLLLLGNTMRGSLLEWPKVLDRATIDPKFLAALQSLAGLDADKHAIEAFVNAHAPECVKPIIKRSQGARNA